MVPERHFGKVFLDDSGIIIFLEGEALFGRVLVICLSSDKIVIFNSKILNMLTDIEKYD